jgi:hypothetical protein
MCQEVAQVFHGRWSRVEAAGSKSNSPSSCVTRPTIVRSPGLAAAARSCPTDVGGPSLAAAGVLATEVGDTGEVDEPHAVMLNENTMRLGAARILVMASYF